MERHTYDWIRHHAEISPDRIALVDLYSDRRFTYRQLDRRIDAVARFLREKVAPGDNECIAVLCHNSTDLLEIQFACRRLPARFLPLNWRFTVPELEFLLRDAKVKALFVGKEFEEVGREAAAAAQLKCVLSTADGNPSDFERGIDAHAGASPLEIPSLRENTVWTVMYTSGTTGHPKGALITYGMTDCLMGHLAAKVGMSNKSVSLSVLPMFHISGLNTYANPVLYFGGTNYVMRTFDPALCLAMIANPALGLTHFMGVPTHFLFMSQLPEFSHARFEHIESVISGGQAVPLPLIEEYASKGMYLQQGWGMTETCSLIFLLSKEDCISRRGSVGRPVMNVDIRIVDEEL